MNQLIELIDQEIGRLESAREVLTGPRKHVSITPAALLSAVNVKEFPHLAEKHRSPHLLPAKRKKKGGMSPEGRARVAAAQKARWAKIHAKKRKESKAA